MTFHKGVKHKKRGKRLSLRVAIDEFCKECIGGRLDKVAKCTASGEGKFRECPLWKVRSGR